MPSSSLGAQGTPLSLISELIKLEAKLCYALWLARLPPCAISGLQLARTAFLGISVTAMIAVGKLSQPHSIRAI